MKPKFRTGDEVVHKEDKTRDIWRVVEYADRGNGIRVTKFDGRVSGPIFSDWIDDSWFELWNPLAQYEIPWDPSEDGSKTSELEAPKA